MRLSEILNNVEIIKNDVGDVEITEIVYDSRKVTPGCVFVAISGVGTDAHKFVQDALSKGAKCAVVEKEGYPNAVLVKNTRKALALMSANFYGNPSKNFKLIGVTGTNGKTTSTYLIKHILEKCGYKVGLIGTIQNMVGDRVMETGYTTPEPLQLQQLFRLFADEKVDYAVMEVSSHSLAQERVAGLEFEVSIFTNLTQDHLDYHVTMDNYMLAKAKLFSVSKTGIFNLDDKYTEKMMETVPCRKVTYSVNDAKSDYYADSTFFEPTGVKYRMASPDGDFQVGIKVPGKFTVYNSLGVIAACRELGIPTEKIVSAISEITGVKGRVEVVPTKGDYTVLIDYAHTPDAIENVLSTVREVSKGRVVVLFGCGGDRDRTKRPKMGRAAFSLADFCIVTSDNPRSEDPNEIIKDIMEGVKDMNTPYTVIPNRKEAIEYAIKNAKKDDIIVLAGKGHETYQILADKTIHFDEREVIADIYRNMEA